MDVGYLPNFSQGLGDEETQLSSPGGTLASNDSQTFVSVTPPFLQGCGEESGAEQSDLSPSQLPRVTAA